MLSQRNMLSMTPTSRGHCFTSQLSFLSLLEVSIMKGSLCSANCFGLQPSVRVFSLAFTAVEHGLVSRVICNPLSRNQFSIVLVVLVFVTTSLKTRRTLLLSVFRFFFLLSLVVVLLLA